MQREPLIVYREYAFPHSLPCMELFCDLRGLSDDDEGAISKSLETIFLDRVFDTTYRLGEQEPGCTGAEGFFEAVQAVFSQNNVRVKPRFHVQHHRFNTQTQGYMTSISQTERGYATLLRFPVSDPALWRLRAGMPQMRVECADTAVLGIIPYTNSVDAQAHIHLIRELTRNPLHIVTNPSQLYEESLW